MRKIRKYIVAWVLVVIAASGIFFNPLSPICKGETIKVLAAEEDGTHVSTYKPMVSQDQYGYTGWDSLETAQNYYGTDFSYYGTAGHPYNYFYNFSDGTRMYFGVKER